MQIKPERTFETRLLFLNEIFSNLYSQDQIMTSCILYKLGKSFDNYTQELNTSMTVAQLQDPLVVIKKLNQFS